MDPEQSHFCVANELLSGGIRERFVVPYEAAIMTCWSSI